MTLTLWSPFQIEVVWFRARDGRKWQEVSKHAIGESDVRFLIIGTFGRAGDQRALYAIARSMAGLDCYQAMLVTLESARLVGPGCQWYLSYLSCDQRKIIQRWNLGSSADFLAVVLIPTAKRFDSGNGVGLARQPKNLCTDLSRTVQSFSQSQGFPTAKKIPVSHTDWEDWLKAV